MSLCFWIVDTCTREQLLKIAELDGVDVSDKRFKDEG